MVSSRGVLYRILYDAVLSRLPEPTAIALGQTALRLLPFDRLPAFRLDDSRLAVTLGGARLPNPVILAAMYYDSRILERAMRLGFGAVTTKTITRDARPGHPRPNLVRVRTGAGPGLVNCNGFQNPGLVAFTPTLRGLSRRVPVIASVAGESEDDYVDLARALGASADLVEPNISSPNTRLVYAWSTRPKDLRRMLERPPRRRLGRPGDSCATRRPPRHTSTPATETAGSAALWGRATKTRPFFSSTGAGHVIFAVFHVLGRKHKGRRAR